MGVVKGVHLTLKTFKMAQASKGPKINTTNLNLKQGLIFPTGIEIIQPFI